MLAPKAEVSIYPWKEPKERIALAVRHVLIPAGASTCLIYIWRMYRPIRVRWLLE